MEANEQSKPKYSEFEKDFIKFNEAKNEFLKKHGLVIGGFRTYKFRSEEMHRIELETLTDEKALNELYDMKN
ncbi:hypothetical protein [Flavobacterium sp. HNIBRBA15423]|uniref:hypothetical protein n=1 Tax=Flavobacterium sp. HNIBRBA15423 TaxID=3458683 RepID=UPI00404464F3